MALFSAADQTPDTGEGSCPGTKGRGVDLMEAKGNFHTKIREPKNRRNSDRSTAGRAAACRKHDSRGPYSGWRLDGVLQNLMSLWLGSLLPAASEVAGNSKRLRLCSRLRLVTETL